MNRDVPDPFERLKKKPHVVPDLAPKAVLLDSDGKPIEVDERSHAERAIAAARALFGFHELRQAALEDESLDAASNRELRRGRVRAWKAARRRKAGEPGKARALRRRRAKNAVAKQSRKGNR